MKPFDLKAALNGEYVMDGIGNKVTDFTHYENSDNEWNVVCLKHRKQHDGTIYKLIHICNIYGQSSALDGSMLFMAEYNDLY